MWIEVFLPSTAALVARFAFHTFDILLTGVVIGGGADGIHTIVGAVLDYMDMISQKAQNAAKASAG